MSSNSPWKYRKLAKVRKAAGPSAPLGLFMLENCFLIYCDKFYSLLTAGRRFEDGYLEISYL